MKRLMGVMGVLLLMALPWEVVFAQDLMVYPAKGQSQEQTEKDKFECYTWAKGQTGFDPMQVPKTSSPPPPQTAGSVGGGAAKGGLGGGLLGLGVGAIAGGKSGAKKGAAIGGLSGAAIGGMRSHSQQQGEAQARQQWEQQQASEYAQKRGAYDRAYAACLEGKGYSVK
jgi:predicted lipid-binding transport protein (Tim44 family)